MSNTKYTTFYIVRHGQTDWNHKKIIQGQTDIELNAMGIRQAEELAKKLRTVPFDLAFSSDMLRAKKTAEIIALEHELAVDTTKMLRERDFGALEGKPSKVLGTYLKLLAAMQYNDRFTHKLVEDAESDDEVCTRIIQFLRETAFAHVGKNILVAAHGGTIRVLLVHLGYLTYEQIDKTQIQNTGYIKIRTDGVDFFIDDVVGVEQWKR
jgi:probable phosphoglycerate mutase